MSVKIRLKRMGMKKKPFYRVVVADIHSPRDGRFIEEIGYYNPMVHPAEVKVDGERAKYWLTCGAQPTDTVRVTWKPVLYIPDRLPVQFLLHKHIHIQYKQISS